MSLQKNRIAMKIYHQPIDVCPLCSNKIDAEDKSAVKIESNGRLVFYAHKGCVKTLNDFLKQIREMV